MKPEAVGSFFRNCVSLKGLICDGFNLGLRLKIMFVGAENKINSKYEVCFFLSSRNRFYFCCQWTDLALHNRFRTFALRILSLVKTAVALSCSAF